MPRTLEEKIVAHADNLIEDCRRVTLDEALENMKKNVPRHVVEKVERLGREIEELRRKR
jgi:uncharacterized protein